MSRRTAWLLMSVSAVVVLVGSVAAWRVFVALNTDPAASGLAYAHQVVVSGQFVDVTTDATGDDSCNCVQMWFVGPAGTDPVHTFNGPDLTWMRTSGPTPAGYPIGLDGVAAAQPTTAATGRCQVSLMTETPDYLNDLDRVALTDDQLQGWYQKQLQVVELDITCDQDVGRL